LPILARRRPPHTLSEIFLADANLALLTSRKRYLRIGEKNGTDIYKSHSGRA